MNGSGEGDAVDLGISGSGSGHVLSCMLKALVCTWSSGGPGVGCEVVTMRGILPLGDSCYGGR